MSQPISPTRTRSRNESFSQRGCGENEIVKRLRVVLGMVVGLALPALAHDPFEINSVAYLYSNRIEIFVELEFPTGMTLAGQKPVRDVAALSQFEAALPQLRELAGRFYDLTAGNNVVLP